MVVAKFASMGDKIAGLARASYSTMEHIRNLLDAWRLAQSEFRLFVPQFSLPWKYLGRKSMVIHAHPSKFRKNRIYTIQEFPHFFGTNKITPKAKWKAAKQRAPEPPLFRLSQHGKGQQRDVALSPPEHCHQWRELLVVEQHFSWPIETHFHFKDAYNFADHLNPQPSNITFWGNSSYTISLIDSPNYDMLARLRYRA